MKSICFIQPPQPQSIDDKLNPSLSLLYLAAYTRDHGYKDVSYCELAGIKGSTSDDFYRSFASTIPEADIFGITFYTPSYKYVEIIVQVIKDRYPTAKIAVGGPHPSALPEDCLNIKGINGIFANESEKSFVSWLDNNCPDGIFKSQQLTEVEMNELSLPARDLINYNDYTKQIDGIKCVDAMTSRGCPWNCAFCFKCSLGSNIRYQDIEWVKKDLIDLMNISNTILFLDDVFTLKRSTRLYPLLEWMTNYKLNWRCHAKPGTNTLEDFIKMKTAGCNCIAAGIESGSDTVLKLMNKGVSAQKNSQCIKDINEAGIISKSYFVSMFPGETEKTIEETLAFVEDADPAQFSIYTCTVLPGTDMYVHPEKYGITWISKDWNDYQFVFGNDGLGGFNFETKTMKRDKMIELNKKFVEEMMKRKQRGVLPTFYKDLKWSKE